jgi:signal transduction histidine kinase/response regulator of citrate/malate metabolism
LTQLTKGGFHVVLLNLALPGTNGLQACDQMQAQAPDVPIVVVSDFNDEQTAAQVLARGAQDYLVKAQLDTALLTRAVTYAIKYQHAEADRRRAFAEVDRRVDERTSELGRTNRRLRQDLAEHEQIVEHLETIYHMGWELAQLRTVAAIAQRVLETALTVLGLERASLGLVDAGTGYLDYQYRMVDGRLEPFKLGLPLKGPAQNGIGVAVVQSGQPLNVPDTRRDTRYVPGPTGWVGRSELCVPMRVGTRVIGILNAESAQPNRFTAAHQYLLQALADQTAVALENARLYQEVQHRARELSTLNQAGRTMASTLDLNTVLQQVMAEAKTMLSAEGVAVLLCEPDSGELVFAAVASPSAEIMIGSQVPLNTSIAGWTVREKKATLIKDAQQDERFYERIDAITGLTTHSVLAVPLIFGDKVTGVIEATNKVSGSFGQHDLGLLEALASSAAIAIENARLYKELRDKMRALQVAQAQLVQNEKMAALGRLSSSITHEINNPLQAIQNSLSLLEEELDGGPRSRKLDQYLGIARDEIERISTIMYRMRSFYSGLYGEQLPQASSDATDEFFHSTHQELRPLDLHHLIDHIVQLVDVELRDNRVTVERKWTTALPDVRGNPDHLKQVFLNLILNAIEAMRATGGTLYLSTTAAWQQLNEDQPKRVVLVEFSDTGVGIAAENLSHVFEPFFSTKEAGSGLGLSICYKIIRAHDGHISVESQVGLGTSVTITLPALETT